MEIMIKEALKRKRDLDAERRFLQNRIDRKCASEDSLLQKLALVEQKLATIETWLMLLSDDEVLVIKRHLIDGIDLPRVAVEYRERWGEEFSKTERTIKSYQRRAIKKIMRFEEEHPSWINSEAE